MHQLWIVAIIAFIVPIVVNSYSPLCTEEYCKTVKCLNGTTECDYIFPKASQCRCCDICVTFLKENARCIPTTFDDGLLLRRKDCSPHLVCNVKTNKCEKRTDKPCLELQKVFDEESKVHGIQHVGVIKPTCDMFGNFEPVQCRPGSICYCVDVNNTRVFGQTNVKSRWRTKCACSRNFEKMRIALEAKLNISKWEVQKNFLPCLENGDYDPLQCINGKCFCINETIHQVGKIMDEKDKGRLFCYNPDIHDPANHHLCYQEYEKLEKRKKHLEAQGQAVIGMKFPDCDLDGSYAPKQCRENDCICVDRENEPIVVEETFYRIDRYSATAKNMKCHCAREQKYQMDSGQFISVECDDLGNYKPIQCLGSLCFCVNENGHQVGAEFDISLQNTHKCKKSY